MLDRSISFKLFFLEVNLEVKQGSFRIDLV